MADSGQKTEQPTQKRLQKARTEGQFPTSREFVSAMQFLTFAAVLHSWGGEWFQELRQGMRHGLGAAFNGGPAAALSMEVSRYLLIRMLEVLAPAGGVLLLVTLGMQLIATRLGVSLKKLMPDFKRLNPMARLKDLPRQNVPALLRALIMLPLFGFAVYGIVRDNVFALHGPSLPGSGSPAFGKPAVHLAR